MKHIGIAIILFASFCGSVREQTTPSLDLSEQRLEARVLRQ